MNRLTRFPAWLGVLAIPLMLLVGPVAHAEQETTALECIEAYLKSYAGRRCEGSTDPSGVNVFVNANGECELADTCPTDAGEMRRTNVTVKLKEIPFLSNCDGKLKVQPC